MNFGKLFIYFLALTVFLNTLLWILAIPYNEGPDEYTHFDIAKFIAAYNRFPIFGKDENMGVSKFDQPNFRSYNNASYSIMPPLAYIIQAVTIKAIPGINERNFYISARISSALLSIIFVFIIFKLAKILFSRFYHQLLFVLLAVFTPQITFIFSYVNSDALALVLSSALFYYLILIIKDKYFINYKNSFILGIFLGLTALSRYNTFIIFPFIGLLYLNKLRFVKNWRDRTKFLFALFFPVILISAWWYIRNLILYQELLGTKKFWETVYMLHPKIKIERPMNTFQYVFFERRWLWESFKTFWASFGWNHIFLAEIFYRMILLVFTWSVFGMFNDFKKNKQYQKIIIVSVLIILSSLALSLWQSFKYAFQAQGRYIFPVFPAVIFIIVYGLFSFNKNEWYQLAVFLFFGISIIFLNIYSLVGYLIPAYY